MSVTGNIVIFSQPLGNSCADRALITTVLCLVLFHALTAGTNGIIEGVVRDKESREPLIGATVIVVGTVMGGTTDDQGRFRISSVRAGVYDVRVSYLGYRTVLVRGVSVLADLRTTVNVELDRTSIEMEAVEVRAERPLIQRELAGTSFNVGAGKMDLLPVSTVQEVLSLQPGTTLEGNVRGGKTTEVVYLVDGLPFMDVLGGGITASIPRSAISGITMQTGGFDAEYGNAQSGVVNIVTRMGGNEPRWSIRYERDSWLPDSWLQEQNKLIEAEVAGTGPWVQDKLSFFTANVVQSQDTRWWQDFRRQFDSPIVSDVNGLTKLEYMPSALHRVSLQALYSLRDWRDYEFSWRFNLAGLPERSRRALRGTISYGVNAAEGLWLTLTASGFYQHSKIGEGAKEDIIFDPYEYDFFLRYIVKGRRMWWADTRQLISTGKLEASFDGIDEHSMKFGAEINFYDLTSDLVKYEPQKNYFGRTLPAAPLLNYSNAYAYQPRSGSMYIQDKVQVALEGSILSVGFRWDWLDPRAERPIVEFIPTVPGEYQQVVSGKTRARFKHQFSPRLSYSAPFGPSTFVFVNFGQYFQFPLFDYLYSGQRPEQIALGAKNVQAGNPDLQAERTVSWEFGMKYGLSTNAVGSVTYFRKRMLNQVDAKTLVAFDSKYAGDFGFASYVNNAEAKVEGLEVVISREVDEKLRGSMSYSYMVTEGISEYVDQKINFEQWGFPPAAKPFPLSWDQRHTLKGDAEFLAFGFLRTNCIILYNSARPYTYYPTRDGFTSLDTSKVFLPNNARMRSVVFVNMKMSMELSIGAERKVTVYADARNIVNKMNVRWMDSSGRIGGELKDPGGYYDPRRVRVGLEMRW